MITIAQLNALNNDEALDNFVQLYNQSCLAVCLDLLIYDQNQIIQNRWNDNRENYGPLQNLNQAPAPDRDEIANFLAQDFEEAPEGFRHIQVPDLNTPLERQNFANQVNAELNNSDIIITGIVGHARIYFRNQNRLFSPGMPDGDGSRLTHWNPGPIAYQVNANNQFELWGEITPMILTCNF